VIGLNTAARARPPWCARTSACHHQRKLLLLVSSVPLKLVQELHPLTTSPTTATNPLRLGQIHLRPFEFLPADVAVLSPRTTPAPCVLIAFSYSAVTRIHSTFAANPHHLTRPSRHSRPACTLSTAITFAETLSRAIQYIRRCASVGHQIAITACGRLQFARCGNSDEIPHSPYLLF
jgi:hypothetical protein